MSDQVGNPEDLFSRIAAQILTPGEGEAGESKLPVLLSKLRAPNIHRDNLLESDFGTL